MRCTSSQNARSPAIISVPGVTFVYDQQRIPTASDFLVLSPPGFWRIRAGVWRIDDEFVATATNVRRDLSAVDFVREDEQEQ